MGKVLYCSSSSPPVLEAGDVVGFVCSFIRNALPSTASTPACHPVTDAFALGPQPIVIRPMQAAPSFVAAAARWLCKPSVHVSQAQPATNALDCFGSEQSRSKRVRNAATSAQGAILSTS
jgi:hypothetical protein